MGEDGSAPAGADGMGVPVSGWPSSGVARWRTYRRGEASPWRHGEPGPGRRTVSVRLGDDEIAELRSAAELAGLRLSGYIAEAALAAARNTRPPMHDPLRDCLMEVLSAETQLRRVGGNLNQAVAALHATGTAPAWLEHALGATMRVVARVDETIDALGRHIDRADRRRQRDRRPPST